MDLKEIIPRLGMTGEEFIAAYKAAPVESRIEVRRLLAEDCRRKGDTESAERLLSIKD